MNSQSIYDITIIGGGPVGLFAAFCAGMRNAKTKLIDGLPQLGGQLTTLYPEKNIYDIPGLPEVTAAELIDRLSKQNRPFQHTYCLEEEVQEIEQQADGIFCLSTAKQTHYSKAIIITTGSGAFEPRRLNIEDAVKCEGKTLHYFVTNLNLFTGKKIVLCGGGDSAVDWALMLEPIAEQVTLLHRRPQFRAQEHSLDLLAKSTVQVKTPFVIDKLNHKNGCLSSLIIKNPKEDVLEELPADHLIVNYGFATSNNLLKKWGLELNRQKILVDSTMSTSKPGIYAAGDSCSYPGKIDLIATGFGEAPTAVNNALHFINPAIRPQPGHSTSLFDTE